MATMIPARAAGTTPVSRVQATTKGWLARRLDLLEDGEYVGPPSPGVPKASASEASA